MDHRYQDNITWEQEGVYWMYFMPLEKLFIFVEWLYRWEISNSVATRAYRKSE